MGKSVYSLVLMDEVVDAVDREAYLQNTSRSNLINQILAEHLCMMTPRQMMRDIYNEVSRFMEDQHFLQIQPQPSDAMFSVRSALQYKYKPTIRYMVEMFEGNNPKVGELRVMARTQSRDLLQLLGEFFERWKQLELTYRKNYFDNAQLSCGIRDGKFVREFYLEKDVEPQVLGRAIGLYILAMDTAMKAFFQSGESAASEMKKAYETYLKKTEVIL